MNIKILNKKCVPKRKFPTDAGMDLRSSIKFTLEPSEELTVPLGFMSEVPVGYAALILPRSGLGSDGSNLRNVAGVIDCTWRGEWQAKVINKSKTKTLKIDEGDRVFQCLIIPVLLESWDVVENLTETERGTNGFGHSGVK